MTRSELRELLLKLIDDKGRGVICEISLATKLSHNSVRRLLEDEETHPMHPGTLILIEGFFKELYGKSAE